jgi:hypothetical protein
MTVLSRLWDGWQRFFFTPKSATALGVVRIAFGCALVIEAYGLAPDVVTWFGSRGLSPLGNGGSGLSVFRLSTSPAFVVAVFVLFVGAAAFVTLGLFTRPATITAYVLLLSFGRRDPYIMNSGDLMLRLMLGLLCLAPAGAALSVDRWRKHKQEFWDAPLVSMWAVRLMQIQLSIVYLSTVWLKLRASTWKSGEAMYYGFMQPDLARVHLPSILLRSGLAMRVTTWGFLATELALALLIWNRRARPFILAVGVVAHIVGHILLVLSVFTYVVLSTYLVFLDPDWCDERLRRLRLRRRRQVATVDLAGRA